MNRTESRTPGIAIVTGGAGFIGSHMVDCLLDAGFAVRVLDNLVCGRDSNLAQHERNLHLTLDTRDIRSIDADDSLFDGVRYIFHFASADDHQNAHERPQNCMDTNVMGTVRMLEGARRAGVSKFLYAGSAAGYAPSTEPLAETHPHAPANPYQLSKHMGESVALRWHAFYQVPVQVLRIFNAYGVRSRTFGNIGSVFDVFLKQKLAGHPFTIRGDGTQCRDFIYISDVVQGFFAAACSEIAGEIYNIGSGVPYTINYLVELLGGPVSNVPPYPGDPHCILANIDKSMRELNWKPKIGLAEGVALTLAALDYWSEAPLWTAESLEQADQARQPPSVLPSSPVSPATLVPPASFASPDQTDIDSP